MNLLKALFVIYVICLLGCAPAYLPVPRSNTDIIGQFAILTMESEKLTVGYDLWSVEPQFLPNYYTTISVQVHNQSQEKISLQPEDFLLLNENKIQYENVTADDVIAMILVDPSNAQVVVPHNQQRQQVVITEVDRPRVENRIRNLVARYNEYKYNITRKAFTFGDIHPGAAKEGILYFPRLDSKNQEFTLVYKGEEIIFRKSKGILETPPSPPSERG